MCQTVCVSDPCVRLIPVCVSGMCVCVCVVPVCVCLCVCALPRTPTDHGAPPELAQAQTASWVLVTV